MRVKREDPVGLVDHVHRVRHLQRRGRGVELAARVQPVRPSRRVELQRRRLHGLALRDAKGDGEAERIVRVNRAVLVLEDLAVARELGRDRVEVGATRDAESRLAQRRAFLDRGRQPRVVDRPQHDGRAVAGREARPRLVAGQAEIAPETP